MSQKEIIIPRILLHLQELATLSGRMEGPLFDTEAEAEDYLEALGVFKSPWKPPRRWK